MEWTGERVVPHLMRRDAPTLAEHLARYAWAVESCAGATVLDAACGCGYGSSLLSCVASQVMMADISEDAIDYGASQYPYFCPIDSAVMDFDTADLRQDWHGEFDRIVSFETIEHLQNPANFIESLYSWLRPGGILLCSVPINSPSKFHLSVFTSTRFLDLVTQLSWTVISTYGQSRTFIAPSYSGEQFLLVKAVK